MLFPGKLCSQCKHLYVAPAAPAKKMGRPVGAVPYDKAAYNKRYYAAHKGDLNKYRAGHARRKRSEMREVMV